jgi:hypothetical protein
MFAAAVALAPFAAAAQSGPPENAGPAFEVRGRIVDTAGVPIPRASVTLRPQVSHRWRRRWLR